MDQKWLTLGNRAFETCTNINNQFIFISFRINTEGENEERDKVIQSLKDKIYAYERREEPLGTLFSNEQMRKLMSKGPSLNGRLTIYRKELIYIQQVHELIDSY